MKKVILIMVAIFAIHGMKLGATGTTYWGGPADVTDLPDGSAFVRCDGPIVAKCMDVNDDHSVTIHSAIGDIHGTVLSDPGADDEGRLNGTMVVQIGE